MTALNSANKTYVIHQCIMVLKQLPKKSYRLNLSCQAEFLIVKKRLANFEEDLNNNS